MAFFLFLLPNQTERIRKQDAHKHSSAAKRVIQAAINKILTFHRQPKLALQQNLWVKLGVGRSPSE